MYQMLDFAPLLWLCVRLNMLGKVKKEASGVNRCSDAESGGPTHRHRYTRTRKRLAGEAKNSHNSWRMNPNKI